MCCATYADYLRENGFTVEMNTSADLEPVRERYRIPEDAVGCHTSVVDGYVVEGHVPVEAIDRLLAERPTVDGISVVGMARELTRHGRTERRAARHPVVQRRSRRGLHVRHHVLTRESAAGESEAQRRRSASVPVVLAVRVGAGVAVGVGCERSGAGERAEPVLVAVVVEPSGGC